MTHVTTNGSLSLQNLLVICQQEESLLLHLSVTAFGLLLKHQDLPSHCGLKLLLPLYVS